MFTFKGELDVSKSWMNRALILQSYAVGQFQIQGDSSSDDVRFLKISLQQFAHGEKQFYVGLGGTTLRFLALRISREAGEYLITADSALWLRPQNELLNIFKQFAVEAQLTEKGLIVKSRGWKKPSGPVAVSTADSSQFLSSVVLNAIDLDFDLQIQTQGEFKSESYFQYTKALMNECGIAIQQVGPVIIIPQKQILKSMVLQGELDVSSAFSLVGAAVLAGDVQIDNWKKSSLQPDMKFLNLFKAMQIPYLEEKNQLKIKHCSQFHPLEANLGDCPDLFPVLAVLCAFANGKSRLYGASQLVHKESNRIQKTAELLTHCGFEIEELPDGLVIHGDPEKKYFYKMEILFDPDDDHRMAMAASLLRLKGFPLRIKNPNCVSKSYPQFYQHIGFSS
jgi:3-phosphoshikimate 1-carboxyvinyltransferase